ncbi:hypothetical protein E8E11_002569 [Didymella keratinophila]|nr:hypothetical protein E8E11_002569 [Didymella keratinophila]
MKKRLPAFKTTGYTGKGDPDMHTNGLKPGTYLDDRLQGFTVPSFDDLLLPDVVPRSPRHLSATLELNVWHTQALVRALRQPLQPVGPHNLNRYALEQWSKDQICDKIDIKVVASEMKETEREPIHTAKSAGERAVLNMKGKTIEAEVRIPLRNILTFPFLALHGIVGKALEIGIDKAERRGASQKGRATPMKQSTPAKPATTTSTNTTSIPEPMLKRPRKAESGELLTPTQTPRRQRQLDNQPSLLDVWAPRQPTVSPITPRVAPPQPPLIIPRNSLANLEFGLRKRGPAPQKP